MDINSKESWLSQCLYEINKENLQNIQRLDSIEKKRLSTSNVKIFLSYLFNGGFSRIIRRIRKNRNNCLGAPYTLKFYKEFPSKKVVVYTCIWGKYDDILEPFYVNPNIDYRIITDQKLPAGTVWKKAALPDDIDVSNMTGLEINRFCKMFPHKLFKDYDCSIYVDGNVRIVTDMMPIIADLEDRVLGIHDYQVDCIYNMKNAIIAGKKAKKKDVNRQIKKYKKAGFPKHFGAFECNVLVRKHNDGTCIKLMEDWYKEFSETDSKRDQLSFPYILWKAGLKSNFVFSLGHHVRENPRFRVIDKHLCSGVAKK